MTYDTTVLNMSYLYEVHVTLELLPRQLEDELRAP